MHFSLVWNSLFLPVTSYIGRRDTENVVATTKFIDNFEFGIDMKTAIIELQSMPYPIAQNLITSPISSDRNVTLIIDMDETLLHCELGLFKNSFMVSNDAYCSLRPGWKEFLESASKNYELILWSAGKEGYVKMMVDKYLDPDRKYFTHFLYRTNCRAFTGVYWFHYKFIGDIGRDLSRVMAIDNSVYAFGTSLDNLVPIKDYYNDQDDNELLKRLAIIDGFFSSPFNDVREYLIPIFGLTELQKEAKADSLADLEMFKGW